MTQLSVSQGDWKPRLSQTHLFQSQIGKIKIPGVLDTARTWTWDNVLKLLVKLIKFDTKNIFMAPFLRFVSVDNSRGTTMPSRNLRIWLTRLQPNQHHLWLWHSLAMRSGLWQKTPSSTHLDSNPMLTQSQMSVDSRCHLFWQYWWPWDCHSHCSSLR